MSVYNKYYDKCCKIIDRIEDIGQISIMCEMVRMLMSNSDEVIDLVIGQYQDVLDDW